MNRRSFFKSLALLAGSASISPLVFIPKFEAVRWKISRVKPLLVPNHSSWVKCQDFDVTPFKEIYDRLKVQYGYSDEYVPWDLAFDQQLEHADDLYYKPTT